MNEESALLQSDTDASEPPDARHISDAGGYWPEKWLTTLPTAYPVAILHGLNTGYGEKVITIYIGKETGNMQNAAFVAIASSLTSTIVPAVMPILRHAFGSRIVMGIGAGVTAIGLFGSGIWTGGGLWAISLWQVCASAGCSLLHLLTILAIKAATDGPDGEQRFVWHRASYMAIMMGAMNVGAFSLVLPEDVATITSKDGIQPWQTFYWVELVLVLILAVVIGCTRNPSGRIHGENEVGVWNKSDILRSLSEMAMVIIIVSLVLIPQILVEYGSHTWNLVIVISSPIILALLWVMRCRTEGYTTTWSIFALETNELTKVWPLIATRVSISAALNALLFRLPLYSTVKAMISKRSEHQSCSLLSSLTKLIDANFLTLCHIGELVGYVALFCYTTSYPKEILLATSLCVYLAVVLTFATMIICSSSATLALAVLVFLAGASYTSTDNYLVACLLHAVRPEKRATAEALSSLSGDVSSALAIAFIAKTYELTLNTSLIDKFAEGRGRQIADQVLRNITLVEDLPMPDRKPTLLCVQWALGWNFFFGAVAVLLGIGATGVVAYGTHHAREEACSAEGSASNPHD